MKKIVGQMNFEQLMLKQAYERVHGFGDRFAFIKETIDWEKFRPIIAKVYHDNKETGGRPHTDELVLARSFSLQHLYNLSDEELEFQLADRLSFKNFIGFTENVPDYSTFWYARERLQKTGVDKLIWNELQRQLDEKGYEAKKGSIQDASFVESDLGRKRHHKEKQAEKRGEKIEYTPKQLAHIDTEATFSIKHGQVHYGYKNHVKLDVKHKLIREIQTTTASLHDAKISLATKEDWKMYRDKGYFGTQLPKGVIDKTMQRATRGHPLTEKQKESNYKISQIRCQGERPFSVIKKIFNGGFTYVKTLARVTIKEMFKCFAFDLYQFVTIEKKKYLA